MSKPSRFSRIAKLGGLTSKVTSSYLGNKLKDAFRNEDARQRARERLHLDTAKDLVKTVGKMKGAAMKLGQQMAIAAEALDLPEDIAKTLGQLNMKAEPIPFSDIKEDLETELEDTLENLFSRFDVDPIGTASLGQAHSAALPDGTEVVVKVLHRGVEHSVDTDLLALKAILMGSRAMRRPKAEVDAIFEEIKERLTEELDYFQEAANINTFAAFYRDDTSVVIPELHQRWCTERVLTMDRIAGVHINEFAASGSANARKRAATTLAHLYYRQVFEFRTLHADPHPGNYLFMEDGRVGLIDFGCVKRFNEFWVAEYARCAIAIHDHSREEALRSAIELGVWDGQGDQAAEVLWNYLDALGNPFRLGEITLGVDTEQFMEPIMRTSRKLVKYPNIQLPRDIVFLHRSLGGLYTLSRQLTSPVNYEQIVLSYLRPAIARAEGS